MPLFTWEAALGNDPLDATPTFTAFTSSDGRTRLNSLSVSRALGRAGTATSVLENSDGALNYWNTASEWYGNLLTANQASLETATTGWVAQTNCTIGRSNAQALEGSWSLTMTPTIAANMAAMTLDGTTGVPVIAGRTYTAAAWIRSASTARGAYVRVAWYDSGGAFISSTDGATVSDSSSGWTAIFNSGVAAPLTAAYANVIIVVNAANEVHYVDVAVFKGGSSTFWTPGGRGGNMQPVLKVRCRAQWNQLTAVQSSHETAILTGHAVGTNCTLTPSNAPSFAAANGSYVLLMQAVAGGDMGARTDAVAILPDTTYTAVASAVQNGTARNVRVRIRWLTAGLSPIGSDVNGATVLDSGVVFKQATVTATSPSNAAFMYLLYDVLSASAGEVHEWDVWGVFPGTDPTWSLGGASYLMTQYVNKWGGEWETINSGDCTVTATDAFRFFTLAKKPGTAYFDAQMASTPAALYRLNETNKSATISSLVVCADWTVNARDGFFKGSAPSFEVPGALPGEMGTAVGFQRGAAGSWVEIPIAACPSGTGDFSIEAWVRPRSISDVAPVDRIWHVIGVGSQSLYLVIGLDGKPSFTANASATGGTLPATTAVIIDEWNHIVAVKSGTAGPTNWRIYLNGVDVSDHGAETLNGTGNVSVTTNDALLGGFEISGVGQGALDGDLDEVAIYFTALSSGTVATHYAANFGLNEPALTGDRINGILDLRDWPAGDRDIDAGQFTMQAIVESLYDTPTLAYIATGEGSMVESEGYPAEFFVGTDGKAVFQDRAHTPPGSAVEFSDNIAGLYFEAGPAPEITDDGLWTAIVLQATAGQPKTASDAAAELRYTGTTLTRTGLRNADDADVQTMADDLLNHHKAPKQTLRLTIHPVDEPGTMWPQVLGRELNDVITVTRYSLPGGGTPYFGQFRIVGIDHQLVGDDWHTTWDLEPA